MIFAALLAALSAQDVKVLVVDGQNNHNWAAMTPFMKAQFEKTGLFKVDVSTTPPAAGCRRSRASRCSSAWASS